MYYVIISTVLNLFTSSTRDKILYLVQDDEKHLKDIIKRASKFEWYEHDEQLENYKAFYIFTLQPDDRGISTLCKSMFSSSFFLYSRLKLTDIKHSHFPESRAMITSWNEVKFDYDNRYYKYVFSPTSPETQDYKVMRYALSKGAQYAMQIAGTNISRYLVDIDRKIMVLNLRYGFEVMELKEYVRCCWDNEPLVD